MSVTEKKAEPQYQGWHIGIGRYEISADIGHIGKTDISVSRGVSSPEKRGVRPRRCEAPLGWFGGMHPQENFEFWHPNGEF